VQNCNKAPNNCGFALSALTRAPIGKPQALSPTKERKVIRTVSVRVVQLLSFPPHLLVRPSDRPKGV
jgi:hypothetical protein